MILRIEVHVEHVHGSILLVVHNDGAAHRPTSLPIRIRPDAVQIGWTLTEIVVGGKVYV